jgi:hypothetical protein
MDGWDGVSGSHLSAYCCTPFQPDALVNSTSHHVIQYGNSGSHRVSLTIMLLSDDDTPSQTNIRVKGMVRQLEVSMGSALAGEQ